MTSAVNPWEIESQPIVTYCPARHICLILFGRTVAPLVVVRNRKLGDTLISLILLLRVQRSPPPSAATDRCIGPACTPCRRDSRTQSPPTRIETSRGDAAAYDGPAGSSRDNRSVSYGSRSHPRLGHLDFADFHFRDAGAERDPRGLDLLPEGLRLRLQVGGVLVGTDPNELVLRPIDPGRHDRPADLVMDRLGLLFEVLDEAIQLALVDRVNADLCLHLLCLHSRRGVCSRGILSGRKSQTCLLTAPDIPPPLYLFAAYPSPLHDR